MSWRSDIFAALKKTYLRMLQYYKLEQRDSFDMKKTRTVYKLKKKATVSPEAFIHEVAKRRGFSESVISGVLMDVADELEYLLGQGYGVTLPGIGTFTVGVRLKEERKEQLEEEQDAAAEAAESGGKPKKVTEPNARNIELHHINYRKDKHLFSNVASRLNREEKQRIGGREGVRITIDDSSQKQRIAAAHEFLETHSFMRVSDYAEITGLSRSSAQRELRELVKFQYSGITCRGRGSHRVFVRCAHEKC